MDKPIRKFRVRVVTVPPKYLVDLGIARVTEEWRVIEGRTLAEAKDKAGIQ